MFHFKPSRFPERRPLPQFQPTRILNRQLEPNQPIRSFAAQPQPTRSFPAQPQPTRSFPAQSQPTRSFPAQSQPTRVAPVLPEPIRAVPAQKAAPAFQPISLPAGTFFGNIHIAGVSNAKQRERYFCKLFLFLS